MGHCKRKRSIQCRARRAGSDLSGVIHKRRECPPWFISGHAPQLLGFELQQPQGIIVDQLEVPVDGNKARIDRACVERVLTIHSRNNGQFAVPHQAGGKALEISTEQIVRFREDGFVSVDGLLDENGVEAARNAFDALFRSEFERGILPDEVNWKEATPR